VLRDHWGRPDAHIQSDCGAISNMLGDKELPGWPTPHFAANNSDAAAKALNGGCDLDDGNNFYEPRANGGNGGLPDALASGATTMRQVRPERTGLLVIRCPHVLPSSLAPPHPGKCDLRQVDTALTRTLTNERFRTGLADPLGRQPYTKIGAEQINSTAHQDANIVAATQSMVLLKNEPHPGVNSDRVGSNKKVLPLSRTRSIAVVGPHAVSATGVGRLGGCSDRVVRGWGGAAKINTQINGRCPTGICCRTTSSTSCAGRGLCGGATAGPRSARRSPRSTVSPTAT
jgi:beta-glucosidase-like glycosyl hydrolase